MRTDGTVREDLYALLQGHQNQAIAFLALRAQRRVRIRQGGEMVRGNLGGPAVYICVIAHLYMFSAGEHQGQLSLTHFD